MKSQTQVAVVGAGIGGLAAAARLAHQGFSVDVFEKAAGPGGRCGRIEEGSFRFDSGPTLLLMPEVLRETFASLDRKLEDYVDLVRCDPNYRIHFHGGSQVTFSTDLVEMGQELERLEPGSFGRYLEFLVLGEKQYRTSLERFVGRNYDGALGFFSPANLRKVFEIRAHRKMYAEVARHFQDDRLRAAMSFQTMYLGISPFESPAVYGLLPFTELAVGIWYPKGGMYQLALALQRVALELGVRFHYRNEVKQIVTTGSKATGLRLADGSQFEADAVLCNADLPWAYRHLLDPAVARPERFDRLRYTSSAFMLYLGVKRSYPELLHHNVFFGSNYRESFDDIFERLQVPADPSFYVNVSARTDATQAPKDCDNLYVLVPVPHLGSGIDWKQQGPLLRRHVLDRLTALGCHDLEANIVVERQFTVDDYASELNLDKGSAFGLSHHFFQVGPFRPANQDAHLRNLFFVGASTQPGTGLPMVMLSARLVTERLLAHAGPQPPRELASWRASA